MMPFNKKDYELIIVYGLSEEHPMILLTIKIIERSKSLRNKVILYLSQIARGIGKILLFARCGINEFQNIEV